jgi:hypothetical protein
LSEPEGELRNDHKFPEFESSSDHFFAKGSDIVLVRVADLLDEPVGSESFEQARHLAAAACRQVAAQRFVLQSADVELAANDGAEQVLIARIEQVESGVTDIGPSLRRAAYSV